MLPGGLVPMFADGCAAATGARSTTSAATSPRDFTAAILSSGFLLDPSREHPALGIGHARLVSERHVAEHDGALANRLRAGPDALRRVERDAVGRDAEDVVGRRLRVAGDAAALDDVLHGGEGHRITAPHRSTEPRRGGEIND